METAQLHWQVFLPSLYSEALLFLLCYLLFLSCMSLRSLALSSWHLRESFLEGTGWLLLQSSRTTSPSGWRGSVLLASSHSPWLPWCPFTKPVLFMYAFLILNRGRGRGTGTLEPVFQKQSECQVKDNRCALSLLSSVLINRAEDACSSLFPGHASGSCLASAYRDPWGFFSAELPLGWAVPTCTTPRAFPSCAEDCCPA